VNPRRRLLLVLPTLLFAGCGFQLRGAPDWPPELNPIHVSGLGARDPFYLSLAQNLRSAGVEILDARSADAAELRVLSLREQRRVLSVTGAARISEYEFFRVLDAELRLPGVAEPQPLGPLRASRVYVFEAAAVLSQSEREQELARAMDRDLQRMLQLRIQAVMGDLRPTDAG
jgi:LPS-assembly lipoprotein